MKCVSALLGKGERRENQKIRETRENLVHSRRWILLKHMTYPTVTQHLSALCKEILFADKRSIKNIGESSR